MKTSVLHTRRQALKQAGIAAVAVAASSLGANAESKKSKRIIVAGGGIGGLSCAFELMERGHDVTVLEASRRTCGHVKTIRDPLPDGLYADVGAEHFTKPGYDEYRRYVQTPEETIAVGCERHAFPFGLLAKIWPRLLEPVGRVHFSGAAFDNLPWGQEAATRSANRVARQIHAS